MPVFIFTPDSLKAATEVCQEEQVLTEGAQHDSAETEQQKKQRIFNEILLPELRRDDECDVARLGQAVYDLQLSGGKRVEIMRRTHGDRICAFMDKAKALPFVRIVGMSSIGPSTVVVCQSKGTPTQQLDDLNAIAVATGMKFNHQTSVNTSGLQIREVPAPRFITVLGGIGSGKTTLCNQLADAAGAACRAVKVGEFLRDFILQNPDNEAAKVIKDIMQQGQVEDRNDVTSWLVIKHLFTLVANDAFSSTATAAPTTCTAPAWLLDGFPRSKTQLEFLLSATSEGGQLLPLRKVAIIDASEATRRQRLEKRPQRPMDPADFDARNKHIDQIPLMVDEVCRAMGVPTKAICNDKPDQQSAALKKLALFTLV